MKIVGEIKKMVKGERKWIDIWYYLQGMYRYPIYYNPKLKKLLLRSHIAEQIDYRIRVMNYECYFNGTCIMCGCMTTALQMCSKRCDGDCYPDMMNKKNWKGYRSSVEYISANYGKNNLKK